MAWCSDEDKGALKRPCSAEGWSACAEAQKFWAWTYGWDANAHGSTWTCEHSGALCCSAAIGTLKACYDGGELRLPSRKGCDYLVRISKEGEGLKLMYDLGLNVFSIV